MQNLFDQTRLASAHAIARGALLPLQSESALAECNGLPYSIVHLSSLSLKDMAGVLQRAGSSNPFAPYDPDLFVAELSPTHVLLLNKFPIIDHHVMAISREFVSQSSPLQPADFDALARMMSGIDGLMMYNGGPQAGASQPHRHVHLMPGRMAPLATIFPRGAPDRCQRIDAFRFEHAFVRLSPDRISDAGYWQHRIEEACAFCGLQPTGAEMPAFNLLGTREWLLVVPRSRASCTIEDITVQVSALDFGGVVSVRNPAQIATVQRAGLLAVLEATTIPRP
jgi:ATP adenylyltransferase